MENKILTYTKNNRNKTSGFLVGFSFVILGGLILTYNTIGWDTGNILIDVVLISLFAIPYISGCWLYRKSGKS